MITVVNKGEINEYYGLSTDVKPTGKWLNGSIFFEMDTGNAFMYDEKNSTWRAL